MIALLISIFSFAMITSTVSNNSIHQFKIQLLNSEEVFDLSQFKGKKILLVNVASKCGYTHQYEDLQALSEQYKDKLVVIGFPCNQFLGQEPGSEEEIATFCQKNYGVTFPITTKIDVKGKEQHPIYTFLTSKDQNGLGDFTVSWNFNKFLVDENGKLIAHFDSKVKPLSEEITALLQ